MQASQSRIEKPNSCPQAGWKVVKEGPEQHHLLTIAARWQEQITRLHIALKCASTKISENQSYLEREVEEEEWGLFVLFFIIHHTFRTLTSPRVAGNPNNPSVRLPRSEPSVEGFEPAGRTRKSKGSRHQGNKWEMLPAPCIPEQGI